MPHLLPGSLMLVALVSTTPTAWTTDAATTTNAQIQGHVIGTAFAAGSDRVVYREEHWLYRVQGQNRRVVLYRCAHGGEPFARKLLSEANLPWTPDVDYEDGRDGYREGLRTEAGQRVVYVRKQRGADERSATVDLGDDTVVDAGFDAFVRAHWQATASPDGTRVRFLVPSRLGLIKLRIKSANDDVLDGVPVRRLRMSLDAWFGFAVPPITLTYSSAEHRLRRFEGLSNVHDAHGGNQTVRIDFPAQDDLSATPQSLQQALSVPLATHCAD